MKRGELILAEVANTGTYNSTSNRWLNTQRANGMKPISSSVGGDEASKLAITTTNVSIFSNGARIGFVQSFTPSEQREITPVQELGTEGVVQMVPGNTRGGQIQISRMALYNSDLWNALGLTATGTFVNKNDENYISGNANKYQDSGTLGNPFRTLKDQRVPLELWADTKLPAPLSESGSTSESLSYSYLREIYLDCWLSNYSKTIQAQNIIVTENATLEYSDMTSSIITGQAWDKFNPFNLPS